MFKYVKNKEKNLQYTCYKDLEKNQNRFYLNKLKPWFFDNFEKMIRQIF